MPRMKAAKRTELESFWRSHLDGWRRSDLNQREYCELHGLPLKRFGNWRATLKHEEPAAVGKLLYRRGGGLKHMSKHVLKEIPSAPSSYIPSARSGGPGRRRNFSEADKRRIVEATCREGASVSGVARQYGIGTRLRVRLDGPIGIAHLGQPPRKTGLPPSSGFAARRSETHGGCDILKSES